MKRYLLEDFEKYAEVIKDRITASNSQINGVDDMPYLICIESEHLVDLSIEYARRYNFIKSVLIDYFGKRRK